MRDILLKAVFKEVTVKHIFTDFFDTIVHRTVHPNYTLRLWAKHLIQELGLPLSIDALYFTRQEATGYLVENKGKNAGEIPYPVLISEVYRRLKNNLGKGLDCDEIHFLQLSESVEYRSESSVQYVNTQTVDTLKHLKSKGYKVYCVSDFYTSESLIKSLIAYHKLDDLFDGIFVSSEHSRSKHEGTFYEYLLQHLGIEANTVMMIGDNYKSDVINPQRAGLYAFHIPNKKEMKIQKKLRFGNDRKDYKRVISELYKKGNKKDIPPYSDYVIFFSLFIEKLYNETRKKRIKNIFFLAREGLFFKKLFDYYQNIKSLDGGHITKTHYLKMSRQSSLQISLKPLVDEPFSYLKSKHSKLSAFNFIHNFTFNEADKNEILQSLEGNLDVKEQIDDFFNSQVFKSIRNDSKFARVYEAHRIYQKQAFSNYLNAFNVDFDDEGIYVVDIGWGGTMQDELYTFFEEKVPVMGYYLGLKEFRPSINSNTGRWGLNFEISPYKSYSDHIMMANTELYEQLAQAPHGSTLGYADNPEQYTIEYHEPNEKAVFDTFINESQNAMFHLFKGYCERTDLICYEPDIAQEIVTLYALKIGTHIPARKLKWVDAISKGFYSNIGNNEVGEDSYNMGLLQGIKNSLPIIKTYIISPEKMVKYIMRTKLMLYRKNKLLVLPTFLLYYFIRWNRSLKRFVGKKVYLKYSHFR